MKKKNVVIIILVLIAIIIALSVVVYLNKDKFNKKEKSKELLAAENIFLEVRLSTDNSYYTLIGLKNEANVDNAIITIPDSIDNIPVRAIVDYNDFARYSKVKTIKIGKNITWIGNTLDNKNLNDYGKNIFLNAQSLTEIIVDEDNPKYSSNNGILFNKDQTVLIKYPNGRGPADDTSTLTYTVGDNVIEVYDHAFFLNKLLKEIVLGENVKSIGKYAFSNCPLLDYVKFNDKLETIESEAFSNCKKLNKIDLPKSLQSVGNGCFKNIGKINIYIGSNNTSFGMDVFTGYTEIEFRTERDNVDNLANLIMTKFLMIAKDQYDKYPTLEKIDAIKKIIIAID